MPKHVHMHPDDAWEDATALVSEIEEAETELEHIASQCDGDMSAHIMRASRLLNEAVSILMDAKP